MASVAVSATVIKGAKEQGAVLATLASTESAQQRDINSVGAGSSAHPSQTAERPTKESCRIPLL